MDKSPFTGIPCVAPCWQELKVGESSESEVIAVLSTLSFLKQDTIFVDPVPSLPSLEPGIWAAGVRITASCKYQPQCLTLVIVDDILTEIIIHPNYEINAEEAIGYLGDPDYIGYLYLGAEEVWCDVYLVWVDKKLVLSSSFKGIREVENSCRKVHDTKRIPSSFIITKINYTTIAAIENLLDPDGTSVFFEYTGLANE